MGILGFRHSEESKRKLSEARKRMFANGYTHPWTGKGLPPEWAAAISAGAKGRVGSRGHAGRKHSAAAIEKIKARRALQVISKEDADRHGAKIRGERHWNWKGGKTPVNLTIRNSTEYKRWRTAVFQRDGYACVECGAGNCYVEADHIKPFAVFPELRFDISNGRTLCRPCHKKIGANPKKKSKA